MPTICIVHVDDTAGSLREPLTVCNKAPARSCYALTIVKALVRSRRAVVFFTCVLGLTWAAACGGPIEIRFSEGDGSGGVAGATASDAAGLRDGPSGGGPDAQIDATGRNDVGSTSPDAATGGAGGGGGAAGRGGSSGVGGTSGSGGIAGGGGAAGSSGSSGRDGGSAGTAGAAGAPGDASRTDADAARPDASADSVDGGSIDRDGGVGDAPIVCDKPPAAGGFFNDATVWQLAGVRHVTSRVNITVATATDLSVLRCLERVDGDLSIENSDALASVHFPNLQTLTGVLRIEANRALTTVTLPMLSTVGASNGQSIVFRNLAALTSLSAPVLVTTPSGIDIQDSGMNAAPGSVLTVDLTALSTLGGGLHLFNNRHLRNLDGFSRLASVSGDIAIHQNQDMVSVSLPNLLSLTGALTVTQQDAVASIALPALTTVGQNGNTTIDFSQLGWLTSISVPSLTTTPGDISLHETGHLRPTTDALAVDFRALTSTGGSLEIYQIPNLVNLEGFPRLSSVGMAFRLALLGSLQGMAFPALATVNTNVFIQQNDALVVAALPSLSNVSAALYITDNRSLTTVALPLLATVGNELGFSIMCTNLPLLGSISAPSVITTSGALQIDAIGHQLTSGVTTLDFAALRSIGGAFLLEHLPRLASLGGFPLLATVRGDVRLSMISTLTSATLPTLASVTGSVHFTFNEALSTIALPSLTSVGEGQGRSLALDEMPALTSIAVPKLASMPSSLVINGVGLANSPPLVVDFGALTQIGAAIEISSASSLQDLNGFARLTSIGGSLLLQGTLGLTSASLPQLTSVGGAIRISSSSLLSIAFSALRTVGSDGIDSVVFESLPTVASIALPRLETTLSSIRVYGTGAGTSGNLTLDFGALTYVGGTLTVDYVHNLRRLAGFPQLATINGDLYVVSNALLAELVPPMSTVTVNGSVQILDNPSLPTCTAKTFAMSFAPAGGTTVRGNMADGCGM